MKPRAVIFDCDGVFSDSEPATDAVIAANLARHDRPLPVRDINRLFIGGTIDGVGSRCGQQPPRRTWPDRAFGVTPRSG